MELNMNKRNETVNEAINALKEYIKEVKNQTSKCKDGYIIYPVELSYKHVCYLLDYIEKLENNGIEVIE